MDILLLSCEKLHENTSVVESSDFYVFIITMPGNEDFKAHLLFIIYNFKLCPNRNKYLKFSL